MKADKKGRVFSGTRPTGKLHLGNYLGAIRGYIDLQNKDLDCIYGVVDLHGITTPYDPKNLKQDTREVVLDYLAAGLDPKKCHIMIQSQIPEHVELAYLLGTICPITKVTRLPPYKEKKKEHPRYQNMGILYYPILMAADILIYKSKKVPIGKDQEPHLEVAQEIARKFNEKFGKVFPVPEKYFTPTKYIPSLLGTGKGKKKKKMSKSKEGSYILLTDDLKTIKERLAKVPTDIGYGKTIPKEGGVVSLLELVELFMGKKVRENYEKQYLGKGIKYAELKEKLAKAIYKELKPIQKRRKYYEEHPKEVDKILEEGRKYCSKIARQTLHEAKKAMGLI